MTDNVQPMAQPAEPDIDPGEDLVATLRSAVSGALWPAMPNQFGITMLALQYQFERTDRMTSAEIQAAQFGQLDVLLRHAVANVPYYRQALPAAGYAPDRPLTLEAWRRLPILTRRTLQDRRAELIAARYPPEHGSAAEHRSSGSTGVPISVMKTQLCDLLWEAFTVRDHLWHRRDLSGVLVALRSRRSGEEGGADGARSAIWNHGVSSAFATKEGWLFGGYRPVEEQIAWLLRRKPDYAQMHPTVLRELLKVVKQRGIRFEGLKGILTYSELVPPGLREETLAVLGIPMHDMYSCREIGYLALECPDHPHYHVQSEAVLIEIVDEAGAPCAVGQTGRVVATPLHNFAQPLIRYALGDYAEVGPPCSCGRQSPVLARVLGRSRNMLRLANGQDGFPDTAPLEKAIHLPIRQYQLVQRTRSHIEVRIVPQRPFTPGEEAELRDIIVDKCGATGCAVTFAYCDSIARTEGGKYEDFISEVV